MHNSQTMTQLVGRLQTIFFTIFEAGVFELLHNFWGAAIKYTQAVKGAQ